jgi:ABC-type Co2+ transport system permease subunit
MGLKNVYRDFVKSAFRIPYPGSIVKSVIYGMLQIQLLPLKIGYIIVKNLFIKLPLFITIWVMNEVWNDMINCLSE